MPHSTLESHLLYDEERGESNLLDRPRRQLGKGPLHPGSTWMGVQRSGRNSYDVKVKIDTVDIEAGTLCGTLEIRDLTPELDSLVTFFEGEIISETGPGFLTANYGATKEDDMRHWRRFPPFTRNRLEHQMMGDKLNLRGASKKNVIFMRWKERFVLPEAKVEAIHGASFAGLYYVCLDLEPATSELFSEASLSHRSISPPSNRPFSLVAPLPRRRLSSQNAPSQLAQTRPPAPSPSSSSPHNSSTETQTPIVVISEPDASVPTSSRPSPPQRSLSSSISYAAALRGSTPASPSLSSSMASSFAASSISSTSTMSTAFSPFSSSSSQLSMTPPTPSSSLPSHNFASASDCPTPKNEFDQTTSTASTISQRAHPTIPPSELVSFLDTTQSPILSSSSSSATSSPNLGRDHEEWPTPAAPSPSNHGSTFSTNRRRATSVTENSNTSTTRSGRQGGNEGEGGRTEKEATSTNGSRASKFIESDETFGIKSWTSAALTGFYHFACSEPYQQLSLRYVPTTNGSSQAFEFR